MSQCASQAKAAQASKESTSTAEEVMKTLQSSQTWLQGILEEDDDTTGCDRLAAQLQDARMPLQEKQHVLQVCLSAVHCRGVDVPLLPDSTAPGTRSAVRGRAL
jgi:hypothetical protein